MVTYRRDRKYDAMVQSLNADMQPDDKIEKLHRRVVTANTHGVEWGKDGTAECPVYPATHTLHWGISKKDGTRRAVCTCGKYTLTE